MNEQICVVVPWHNAEQVYQFLQAWGLGHADSRLPEYDWLVLQQDSLKEGCAMTKNKGVREALRRGADIVVLLDDDCFPDSQSPITEGTLPAFAQAHRLALAPQPVQMIQTVTTPISRGTPYHARTLALPVAASMGFWSEIGDYDAPGQLVHGARTPMQFRTHALHGRYFPLCGMNLAFRPREWLPWCEFIDVPRFDDIWMGWLWQKEAYRRGYCFNLNGPMVRHVRQSNVWANLRAEAPNLERNETLWRDIATSAETEYAKLKALI